MLFGNAFVFALRTYESDKKIRIVRERLESAFADYRCGIIAA